MERSIQAKACFAAAVAAVLIFVAAGFAQQRLGAAPAAARRPAIDVSRVFAAASRPAAQPSAAPEPTTRPASYLVGMPAPSIDTLTFDQRPVQISGPSDKVRLLMFYVAWCPHCERMLPEIEALHKQYKDKGVEVVAINLDTRVGRLARTEEQILAQYRRLNLSIPMIMDKNQSIGPRYRVRSYPTSMLVGKTGIIEAVHFGSKVASDQTLSTQIDLLLQGKTRAAFPAVAAQETPTPPKTPRYPAMEMEGKPAPAAAGETIDGKAIRVGAGSRRIQVLTFYASWCPHCRRAMPTVEQLYKDYAGKGVDVIAISEDTRTGRSARTEEQTRSTYKEWNLSLPMTMDPEQEVGREYKAQSYPTFMLVGRDGTVEAVHVGAAATLGATLRTELDLLLQGKTRADFPTADASQASPSPAAEPQAAPSHPVLELKGKAAPSASAKTFDGKDVKIGSGNGRAQLLAFYASWCEISKLAMPSVQKIHEDYRDKGLQVIAVNVDHRTGNGARTEAQTVETYKDWGLSLPMTMDPGQRISRQYRVSGYPTFFLVSGTGKVEAVYVGGREVSGDVARARIDALLKDRTAAN